MNNFLRFELLEILKKNDFKVDVLNQNRSGKRKRGKLNLEKAMAKNIFDNDPPNDPSKRLNNLFDAINFNSNATKSETDSGNFHKHSKKSTQSGETTGFPKSSEVILKEVIRFLMETRVLK